MNPQFFVNQTSSGKMMVYKLMMAALQPLQASPTMSFPQTCRFIAAGQGGGWGFGPEQLASVYSGCIAIREAHTAFGCDL